VGFFYQVSMHEVMLLEKRLNYLIAQACKLMNV